MPRGEVSETNSNNERVNLVINRFLILICWHFVQAIVVKNFIIICTNITILIFFLISCRCEKNVEAH